MIERTKNKSVCTEIDFVVLWVDSNDPEWQKKKSAYTPGGSADTSTMRYRDWDNLKYWFRAVAKYAPWVRKIHFVSDGQIPEWLNTENPRVHTVNHADYMPQDALPVFNSSAIEIAMHRIPELADYFVFFNDDMFLNASIGEDFFFVNGKPVDMPGLTPKCYSENEEENSTFSNLLKNNLDILNRFFDRKAVLRQHFSQWFKLSYGKTFLRTILNLGRPVFDGIVIPHLAVPYRKSDIERVWKKCGSQLEQVQYNRFRDNTDLSHFLYRYWRLCVGDYYPRRSKGTYISLCGEKSIQRADRIIRKGKSQVICLNDCWIGDDYEKARDSINAAFEMRLPEKCEFEK